jgi:Tfp pilus assembly protein PilF
VVAGDSGVAAYAARGARPSTNQQAYNAYLIGRHQLNRRTSASVDSARIFFERALAADSTYAAAWSGLADAYTLSTPSQYRVPGMAADVALDRALAAARRAVALDPSSGEAHTSLALAYDHRFEWDSASVEWERALTLDPNFAPLRHYYGVGLISMGRVDEALPQFSRAVELDPLYWITGIWHAQTLWLLGQKDEAQRRMDDLVARHPDVSRIHAEAGLMALRRADYERAATEYALVFELNGDLERARRVREGLRAERTRTATGAELARGGYQGLTGTRGVEIAAQTGNVDQARAMLSRVYVRPGEVTPSSLRIAITHPEVVGSPVWRELFARMGVPP